MKSTKEVVTKNPTIEDYFESPSSDEWSKYLGVDFFDKMHILDEQKMKLLNSDCNNDIKRGLRSILIQT